MAEIEIDGQKVILDEADLQKVERLRWRVNKRRDVYARDYKSGARTVWMKWLIAGIPINRTNTLIRHKNGNRFDMRGENLLVEARKWQSQAPRILCACGCGTEIPSYRSCGLPQKFVQGHHLKLKTAEEKLVARRKWGRSKIAKAKDRYQNFKQLAMLFFGAVCPSCGLACDGSNAASFEFDHIDPKTKTKGLGVLLRHTSIELIALELLKCRLLCANCHNLRHKGSW